MARRQPKFAYGDVVLIDTGKLGQTSGKVVQVPERAGGKYYVNDHGFGRFIEEHRLIKAPV